VVAVSHKLRGELLTSGVPSHRLHCVPNCWSPTEPGLDRREARIALEVPPDAPIVGWVGRFSREKAPDVMIRAFAACEVPGARLSMVGSGPLEADCRALAAKLSVQDRVTWHGIVQDASRYLEAFDLVALTSWTEGTPMILLEAIAAGVPVVTTRVGGIPDVVSASEALLVEAGDVQAVAAAVAKVLTDRTGAQARALAARRPRTPRGRERLWFQRHQRPRDRSRSPALATPTAGGR